VGYLRKIGSACATFQEVQLTTFIGDQVAEQRSLSLPRMVNAQPSAPVLCASVLVVADCLSYAAAIVAVFDAHRLLVGSFPGTAFPGKGSLPLDLAVLFVGVASCLGWNGRYGRRVPFALELRGLVFTCLVASAVLATLQALSGGLMQCGALIATLLLFPLIATPANRWAKRGLGMTGAWLLPVVVVGTGPSAVAAEQALTSEKSLGYRVIRRVDPDTIMNSAGMNSSGMKSVGTNAPAAATWRSVLERYEAGGLLVALDSDSAAQRLVIEAMLRERVPFSVVPRSEALPAFSHETTRFFGHDAMLMSYSDGLARPLPRMIKAVFDVVLAAMLLVLVGPLCLMIAIANRIEGGPVLFVQRRVGVGGRLFNCLKFRTMVVNGDSVLREALANDPALADEWKTTRKLRKDPRVTRVGRFLRKTSLDELPQLINILRLDMSLVGPRPIVESEIPLYGEGIAQYCATRPGLTGLWQVSGRSNTSYARRVQLDVWYVNNWALWNDLVVLLKTIPAVLAREGAH